MRTQIIVLFLVTLLLTAFTYIGLPYLKDMRSNKPSISLPFGEKEELQDLRPVQVDISVEDICLNVVTGDPEPICQNTDGCDKTCKEKGCRMFGLIYNSSDYVEKRCFCNCYEQNKIKKALNIAD
jgi:hypothetical protein